MHPWDFDYSVSAQPQPGSPTTGATESLMVHLCSNFLSGRTKSELALAARAESDHPIYADPIIDLPPVLPRHVPPRQDGSSTDRNRQDQPRQWIDHPDVPASFLTIAQLTIMMRYAEVEMTHPWYRNALQACGIVVSWYCNSNSNLAERDMHESEPESWPIRSQISWSHSHKLLSLRLHTFCFGASSMVVDISSIRVLHALLSNRSIQVTKYPPQVFPRRAYPP
jgi:hypothetical protein